MVGAVLKNGNLISHTEFLNVTSYFADITLSTYKSIASDTQSEMHLVELKSEIDTFFPDLQNEQHILSS